MAEMMWAAQLVQPGKPLQVSRIAVPKPGPGELLLKLEASGICHTDLHVADAAAFPGGAPMPLTLGHEGIGRVVEQGPGTTMPAGTRLGAPWLHAAWRALAARCLRSVPRLPDRMGILLPDPPGAWLHGQWLFRRICHRAGTLRGRHSRGTRRCRVGAADVCRGYGL